MRLIYAILLSMVLLVPLVSAEISFNEIGQEIYNYGDAVVLSGEVESATSQRNIFSLTLECPEGTVPLSAKILDLNAESPQTFSEVITLPEGETGRCTIRGKLTDLQTNFLEDASSNAFVITNDIRGDFQGIQTNYQLGDALIISGDLTRYNNKGVDGSATINFNKLDETVNLHVIDVVNGKLDFQKDLSFIPPGEYTVTIQVKDNEGNERTFEELYSFTLEGNLEFSLTQEQTLYLPGNTAFITGNVRSKTGVELNDVEIILTLDDQQYSQTLSSSQSPFTFTIPLSSTIKTGSHEFLVTGKDGKGNIGEVSSSFDVQAVATSLFLNIDKLSFIPGEAVGFEAKLLDQASDPMTGSLTVELIDPDGLPQQLKLVEANTEEAIEIPEGSEPGSWQMKIAGFQLEDERILKILEHTSLDLEVDGDELIIKNDGNVKFKDYLSFVTGLAEKKKRFNLGLGEETRVKLNNILDPGVHTVEVPLTGDVFEDVSVPEKDSFLAGITGAAILDLDNNGTRGILLILLLVVVVALFLYVRSNRQREIYTQDTIGRQEPIRREAVQKASVKEERPAPKRQYGVADEKDIEDFKNRMTKMFSEEDKKKQRRRADIYGSSSGSTEQKSGEQSPDLFNIFK